MLITQLFSDVHLRFANVHIDPQTQLVLALGDLSENDQGIDWLISLNKPTLFVPGNHEFYGYEYTQRLSDLEAKCKGTKVTLLHQKTAIAKGVRFIGTTLWTDQFAQNPALMSHCMRSMNDYKQILVKQLLQSQNYQARYDALRINFELHNPDSIGVFPAKPKHLNPLVSLLLHQDSLSFLYQQLQVPFDGPTVILTHHAPLHQSLTFSGYASLLEPNDFLKPLGLKYKTGRVAGYASDLSFLLKQFQPALWMHGHLHNGAHYAFEQTSIITNPVGYNDKENGFYNPSFVIPMSSTSLKTTHKQMVLHTLEQSYLKQKKTLDFLHHQLVGQKVNQTFDSNSQYNAFMQTYNLFIQPLLGISHQDALQVQHRPSPLSLNTTPSSAHHFTQTMYRTVERNLYKTHQWIQEFKSTYVELLSKSLDPYQQQVPTD